MAFLDYLINGISLGSIYAVIALGYTLVYGIAKMLNFAHGDIIMVGGYAVFTAMVTWGWSTWVAMLFAVVVCTLLGITIEKVAYKPLRKASSLSVLITAIGVSYFLQNLALLIFDEKPKVFTSVVNIPKINLFDGKVVIKGETTAAILV
jgi:branched-chain amino acid transport system permease protein